MIGKKEKKKDGSTSQVGVIGTTRAVAPQLVYASTQIQSLVIFPNFPQHLVVSMCSFTLRSGPVDFPKQSVSSVVTYLRVGTQLAM